MLRVNRRRFLTGIGHVCGTAALGTSIVARGQTTRAVSVEGRDATVVDVHAHCIIPSADAEPGRNASPIQQALTLGPHRIAAMDERGIDVQVLSINQFDWYEAERAAAEAIVARHDTGLSQWCTQHPQRFVALTSVALQFPDLAADQLERAVTELGHRGASIGGHVRGEPPSLPKFDPFWARAEALGVPVFMHPTNAENLVREGALAGRGGLGNIIGNPLETTWFLSRMIFDGALDRFPGLKLCAAHGGGYLPSYLGRTEVACMVRDDAECANARQPSEYFRDQILVDSMVFSAEGLRHLVAETGPSQVVYGSDIPYFWPDTIDLIAEAPFLSPADKRAILGGNLIELLRIDV